MELRDYFDVNADGSLLLEDREFRGVTFRGGEINEPLGTRVRLKNVAFLDCKTDPGACWIGGNVELQNVRFHNFDCGDELRIGIEVSMLGVEVSGSRGHPGLLIKRFGDASGTLEPPLPREDSLDIREYGGRATILGLPIRCVQFNPSDCFGIDAEILTPEALKAAGISGLSHWKILLKKMSAQGAREGVFSFLAPSSDRFQESMEQAAMLRDKGLIF